jgi:hypothetical protein
MTVITDKCVGALDGTHIKASIPAAQAAPYRNRKGDLSFNVLGCVTFDELFCYVYAGWEGSAHDGRVLAAAMRDDMIIPAGYTYLGDAGYPLVDHLLVPYKGVRYHLKEQERAGLR